MNKETLKQYRSLIKEIPLIKGKLDRLYNRLDELPVVSGKVIGSSRDFPYTEVRTSVLMTEPREADNLKKQIRYNEIRLLQAEDTKTEIEKYIAGIEDAEMRLILEYRYIQGMGLYDVADKIGADRSTIGKRITAFLG